MSPLSFQILAQPTESTFYYLQSSQFGSLFRTSTTSRDLFWQMLIENEYTPFTQGAYFGPFPFYKIVQGNYLYIFLFCIEKSSCEEFSTVIWVVSKVCTMRRFIPLKSKSAQCSTCYILLKNFKCFLCYRFFQAKQLNLFMPTDATNCSFKKVSLKLVKLLF